MTTASVSGCTFATGDSLVPDMPDADVDAALLPAIVATCLPLMVALLLELSDDNGVATLLVAFGLGMVLHCHLPPAFTQA